LLSLPFEHDTIPDEARKAFLAKIILEMLDIDDTRRPSADQLYKKFITWGVEEVEIGSQPSTQTGVAPTYEPVVAATDAPNRAPGTFEFD